MKWETHTLPCGHVIDEGKRWCPACGHHVAHIRYGEPGLCPYCNETYKIDKYKFYIKPHLKDSTDPTKV